MTLRNLIAVCTPRTELLVTTRTRYTRILCGGDIRTLYTLNILGKEVVRVNPVDLHILEVTVNEDSPNR